MKIKISTMFTYDCDITEILRIVHLFFPAERKVQMLEGLLKVQKYICLNCRQVYIQLLYNHVLIPSKRTC